MSMNLRICNISVVYGVLPDINRNYLSPVS